MPDVSLRACGSCTACCKSLGVLELKKPPGKWCKHCTIGRGCNVYTTRPLSCQEFRCEWLKGLGVAEERPDQIGVIFDFVIVPGGPEKGQFQIWEVSEGALSQSLVRERTQWALSGGIYVIHASFHGKKVLFIPQGEVLTEEFLQELRDGGIVVGTL